MQTFLYKNILGRDLSAHKPICKKLSYNVLKFYNIWTSWHNLYKFYAKYYPNIRSVLIVSNDLAW